MIYLVSILAERHAECSGQTEICDFVGSIRGHEHVLRLHIAVNDAVHMAGMDASQQLFQVALEAMAGTSTARGRQKQGGYRRKKMREEGERCKGEERIKGGTQVNQRL